MDETREVEQWCPTTEEMVMLRVRGMVKGNLIEGEVLDCSRKGCKARSKAEKFCWVGRHITTATT